ncbi:MAG: AMP-binding protein, partial [Candidatus Aminicenantes bacterium]|nr:AMP-binding protein [Candidatus Aminicenantes bacterium]
NVVDIFESLKFNDDDIMLGNLPLFHVFGYNTNFWLPLLQGLSVVTYPNPLEYKKVVQIIKEEGVTLMLGTPVFFNGYLRQSEPGELSSVRVAVAGADKCPDMLREGYNKKHGITLLEGYGCTETSPVISVNLPNANKPGSTGKPLPTVKVKIADITSFNEVPRGQEGKLLTKGDHVMKGYFDDLEETSLRIKDGWYDTGDMGMVDEDGYVWHRGRLKRFAKIGGEMVSLVRVESILTDLLPPDTDCCVVEIPDYLKGAKIIAAITSSIDEREMLKKMSAELPNLSLPKEFLVIDELPKMGSGKINFRKVTEIVKEKFSDNNNKK